MAEHTAGAPTSAARPTTSFDRPGSDFDVPVQIAFAADAGGADAGVGLKAPQAQIKSAAASSLVHTAKERDYHLMPTSSRRLLERPPAAAGRHPQLPVQSDRHRQRR
ncbi:MAG: hypothetical protein R2708_25375 [Vicinamibacterales bacterium]